MLSLTEWVNKTAQASGLDPEVIQEKIRKSRDRPPRKKKGTKNNGTKKEMECKTI